MRYLATEHKFGVHALVLVAGGNGDVAQVGELLAVGGGLFPRALNGVRGARHNNVVGGVNRYVLDNADGLAANTQALAGAVNGFSAGVPGYSGSNYAENAERMYTIADAMMKARGGVGGG